MASTQSNNDTPPPTVASGALDGLPGASRAARIEREIRVAARRWRRHAPPHYSAQAADSAARTEAVFYLGTHRDLYVGNTQAATRDHYDRWNTLLCGWFAAELAGGHAAAERTPVRGRGQGFASMSDEKKREIARKGGRAAHAAGTAHKWTPEEAKVAGRKGGAISRRGPRTQHKETGHV